MTVKLQLALDVLSLSEALVVAQAAGPYVDWLEAGTVLIKSEGIRAVRELKTLFPDKALVADMKVIDGGAREAKLAFGAGADIITVSACAGDATLQAALKVAADKGKQVMVDLLGVTEPLARAQQVQAMGAHYLCVHRSTDATRTLDAPDEVAELARAVSVPIAAAGSIRLDSWAEAARAGAEVIIVGSAIIKATDPASAARAFQQALRAGVR
jgi:3-hexulose-6-phosphate synthase/6-phospho-3-hexuloisomerase